MNPNAYCIISETTEDRFDVSVTRRGMNAICPAWETWPTATENDQWVAEREHHQHDPWEQAPTHREARPVRAVQAAPSSNGTTAVAAKLSEPVSRGIGFNAASFVIGRLGNAHVVQVKAATASAKRSKA